MVIHSSSSPIHFTDLDSRPSPRNPSSKVSVIIRLVRSGLTVAHGSSPSANVIELQAKLNEMIEKVRHLEEALRRATSSSSSSSYEATSDAPPLSSEAIGHDDTNTRPDVPSDLIDTLGTLTLADGGESRFLGPSAAPEVCPRM